MALAALAMKKYLNLILILLIMSMNQLNHNQRKVQKGVAESQYKNNGQG